MNKNRVHRSVADRELVVDGSDVSRISSTSMQVMNERSYPTSAACAQESQLSHAVNCTPRLTGKPSIVSMKLQRAAAFLVASSTSIEQMSVSSATASSKGSTFSSSCSR